MAQSQQTNLRTGASGVDYERSDARTRLVGLAYVLFVAMLGISALIVYFVFVSFRGDRLAAQAPKSPFVEEKRMPPEPRLLIDPRSALNELRAYEADMLTRYRWVDEQQGVAQIPIERAMDLFVEGVVPHHSGADESDE